MAKNSVKHKILIILCILNILTTISSQPFSKKLSKQSLGFKKEKLTHLHFYFHDIVTSPHPTAVKVASAPITNTSRSFFGLVTMMDDPLTLTPEPGSKVVGRAQGIYASADLKEIGFLMVLNYCFIEGKYNGSTLSILGRNSVLKPMREMAVVGGSGLFRFARGYAQAKTHSIDFKTGNAVVEYNVYVLHY
ncbi:dirigent protein 22-like [Rutidosis leptorrhynchoides]|uniref:dirigent protein 22-like n=1 Tax=Rutidosis leptorrhynchoides TaxID=125765 RepID=UPI003A9A4B78